MSTAGVPAQHEDPLADVNPRAAAGDGRRRAAKQGATGAGLAAVGIACGALLERRIELSRKLRITRRRTRAQAVRDTLVKRLR